MPREVFAELVAYYSQLKKQWNKGMLSLRGSEIQKIREVQRMTDKFHPELNHYFTNYKKAL